MTVSQVINQNNYFIISVKDGTQNDAKAVLENDTNVIHILKTDRKISLLIPSERYFYKPL